MGPAQHIGSAETLFRSGYGRPGHGCTERVVEDSGDRLQRAAGDGAQPPASHHFSEGRVEFSDGKAGTGGSAAQRASHAAAALMEDLMSTILFVDDHHAFRTVFAEILRNAGNTVLEAGTTDDAEHVLERHSGPIDLLIIEAVLTTTNGSEIVQRIQPSHPEMRVLYISEESASSLTQEGLLPKRTHFLHKPFEAEHFMTALRDLVSKTPSKSRRA